VALDTEAPQQQSPKQPAGAAKCVDVDAKSAQVARARGALEPAVDLQYYDVFISYRQGTFGEDIAHELYTHLTENRGRRLDVFLDRHGILHAENFVDKFTGALFNSKIIVPIVSLQSSESAGGEVSFSGSLARMINPGEVCDNVLLEWQLALELLRPDAPAQAAASTAGSRLKGMYPIFVGQGLSFEASRFPQTPHPPTAVKLHDKLLDLRLRGQTGQATYPRLSIKDTVERVKEFTGFYVQPDEAPALRLLEAQSQILSLQALASS
jgi:hypothetical protein